MTPSQYGLTILELLIAIVILSVALLALAAAMTDGMVGIRKDGRRTVANQVATSVIEDIRSGVRDQTAGSLADCTLPCAHTGVFGTAGQDYSFSYKMDPRLVDDSGSLTAATPDSYHVLEVGVDVTTPDGSVHTYRTVVARNP